MRRLGASASVVETEASSCTGLAEAVVADTNSSCQAGDDAPKHIVANSNVTTVRSRRVAMRGRETSGAMSTAIVEILSTPFAATAVWVRAAASLARRILSERPFAA
jgi:hypothetical protein